MRPSPKKLKKNSLFIIFKKLTSYRKYEKKKKKKNTHTHKPGDTASGRTGSAHICYR